VWIAGVLVAVAARGGERPLAATIRAAAEAVRPAVVEVEVKGRPVADPRQRFRIEPAPPGQPRQWRWDFQWPPREGQQPDLPFHQLPEGWPQFPEGWPFNRPGPQERKGAGVIVAVNGDRALVAAPHALVNAADEVFVRLPDGRYLAARLIGADRLTGTGCLEIRGPDLEAAPVGKPDALDVGDWVLAVGGRASGGAVTLGIVSARADHGKGNLAGTPVIQADVTLAEGMSGAPLVSLDGKVVAMTLPAAGRRGQGRQLATAVPIGAVAQVVAQLDKHGKVRRGFLGIAFGAFTREDRERLGMDHGIKVLTVLDGHPAHDAGIQAGDVILEFGGKKVGDTNAFRAMVGARKPGERVAVKLRRGDQDINLEVTLGETPDDPARAAAPEGQPAPVPEGGEKLPIGLTLQPLTAELADQFGFAGDKGLLVTAVEGPAARARPAPIRTGELVKEIAQKPVATIDQAKQAIKTARKANKKTVLLLVRSKDGTRYTVVDLPR
jgi:serine protease Do